MSQNLNKLFDDNKAAPRRYEINAKAEDAEVFIYDAIGGFWGISAEQFVKDFKAIKNSTIHLRINSPGGDVGAARSIATAISQHSAKVIAHIDGLAASAASFLMLAADEIEISAGAMVMVHAPWAMTVGNAEDHNAMADLLNKHEDAMAGDYSRRTGKDDKTVRQWMKDETWFSSQEAVDAGLADRVVETTATKNEWNLSAYRNVPVALCAGEPEAKPAAIEPITEIQGSAPEIKKEGAMPGPIVEPTGQDSTAVKAVVAAAVLAERTRVTEIDRIGIGAGLKPEVIQAAKTDSTTVEAFKDIAINAMFERGTKTETRVGSAAATADVTRDETDTRRDLMVSAILNRVDASRFQVDAKNDFRHMTMMRMAEESLIRAGIPVRGMGPNEVAIKAMHSTSDFPIILENSMRKVLLDAYGNSETTYKVWAKKSSTPDFKTMRRIRKGETPVFLEVPEGAEITMGTMGEERESYALLTYGRGISFTRQMLINDDLGAFNDLSAAFGLQAARLENKIVYAILTANALMNDGVALFDAAHGNSGTGVIANTGLDAMFVAMATQKGIDGVTLLNIKPKWLLVPPAKRMTAITMMKETGPSLAIANQNWFAGTLDVVSDAELTDTAKWYGVAPTGDVEYAHLAGAEGVQMIRRENEGGILGVQMWAFLDFAAKAVGWKGLYYSTGS